MELTMKFLLRSKINTQGQYPVIFRVTKNRKSKIFTLNYKARKEEWDSEKQRFNKRASNYILKNKLLNKMEQRALIIIDDFMVQEVDFTLRQFELKLRNNHSKNITLNTYLVRYISMLESVGKYGASEPFRNLKAALEKNYSSPLKFEEINYHFLKEFEMVLRKTGSTDGGIAFKMRHLRVMFNNAINDEVIDVKYYPFRKYKISKLKGENEKIALSERELRRFENLNLKNHYNLIKSHKYFLFSFYCRGINWEDMIRLKKQDIFDGKIHYRRKKTKRPFIIKILPPVQSILDFFEKENPHSRYVFPILINDDYNAKQLKNRKHKTLKVLNKDLKELALLASISKPITSYVARHTYATILKYKNVSVEAISELMGHSDVRVTKSYLKDFEDKTLDDLSRNVLKECLPKYQYQN